MDSLRISYGSAYELLEIMKKHPREVGKYHKLYVLAQKKVDDLTMDLAIFTAEFVDEKCRERKVPASARQEIRRAEVQLDIRWQKISKKLNATKMVAGILNGRLQGLYARRSMLDKIADFEKKWMYAGVPIYKDNSGVERKTGDAMDDVQLPDDG